MTNLNTSPKKAIVIGAGSGIGRAIAKKLSTEGYVVGIAGRNQETLGALQNEIQGETVVRVIDVRDVGEAMHELRNLIMVLAGVDLIIINAGVLVQNETLAWAGEEEMIKVNAMGFAAMINVAVEYFFKKKTGCIVGISSVASHRGSGRSPSYNASKAFVSNYMEGLRQKFSLTDVKVIDIRPGFVNTKLLHGRKGLVGIISPEIAAEKIYKVIQKRKRVAYVPGWWRVVVWFLRKIPESVYHWGYRRYYVWDNKK